MVGGVVKLFPNHVAKIAILKQRAFLAGECEWCPGDGLAEGAGKQRRNYTTTTEATKSPISSFITRTP